MGDTITIRTPADLAMTGVSATLESGGDAAGQRAVGLHGDGGGPDRDGHPDRGAGDGPARRRRARGGRRDGVRGDGRSAGCPEEGPRFFSYLSAEV